MLNVKQMKYCEKNIIEQKILSEISAFCTMVIL